MGIASIFSNMAGYSSPFVASASRTKEERPNARPQSDYSTGLPKRKPIENYSVSVAPNPSASHRSVGDSPSEDWSIVQSPDKTLVSENAEVNLPRKENLAHELAYNLEGLEQVELPTDSGKMQLFRVMKVHGDHVANGLNAYILYPEVLSGQERGPVEVKLLFRGTGDMASAVRDLDPVGAGSTTLDQAAETIHESLDSVLETVHKACPDRGAKLTVAGHSLGGADVQNYAGHLLNRIADQKASANREDDDFERVGDYKSFRDVVKIEIFTKNSAGVSEMADGHFRRGLGRLKKENIHSDVKVDICHLKVHGDLVQATGDCFIGSGVEEEAANVKVLKLYTCPDANRVQRHTSKFFRGQKRADVYGYDEYTNKSDTGRKKIKRSLCDTPSKVLRTRVVKTVQAGLYHLLQRPWFVG